MSRKTNIVTDKKMFQTIAPEKWSKAKDIMSEVFDHPDKYPSGTTFVFMDDADVKTLKETGSFEAGDKVRLFFVTVKDNKNKKKKKPASWRGKTKPILLH